MFKRELRVGTKKGRKIGSGEGGGGEIVILSTSTSTQIPNYKTSPPRKKVQSKQHSKQAIRQGKLRKITKCLLTRFS